MPRARAARTTRSSHACTRVHQVSGLSELARRWSMDLPTRPRVLCSGLSGDAFELMCIHKSDGGDREPSGRHSVAGGRSMCPISVACTCEPGRSAAREQRDGMGARVPHSVNMQLSDALAGQNVGLQSLDRHLQAANGLCWLAHSRPGHAVRGRTPRRCVRACNRASWCVMVGQREKAEACPADPCHGQNASARHPRRIGIQT